MRPLAAFLICVLISATASASPLAWQGSTEVAAGRGERGPWQQNDSRYDYVDDGTAAIDEQGGIAIAWVDQGRKDVFFRRLSPMGEPLGQAINVSRNPATFSWLPRIVRSEGKVFVLWQEIIFSGGSHGGDILFARSDDGGATFSQPLNLSNSIGGDGKGRISKEVWDNGSLDLATGADGAVYAAWTEYDGPLWLSVSGDGGRSFSSARRIAGDSARPARGPSLAVGPEKTVYLAWTIGEDPHADIRVARSTDGGAHFTEPLIVAPGKGFSDAPKLAVDRHGAVHLAYSENHRVLYTRSADGARSFEPPRDVSGSGAGFPSLALDAQANVFILWERFPKARARPRGLSLVVSHDGGKTFAPPEAVPGSADAAGGGNGSYQGLLMKKLAVNGRGDVAIVNSSLNDKGQDDQHSRLWVMRGTLSSPNRR
jgi:hypothetical protein